MTSNLVSTNPDFFPKKLSCLIFEQIKDCHKKSTLSRHLFVSSHFTTEVRFEKKTPQNLVKLFWKSLIQDSLFDIMNLL